MQFFLRTGFGLAKTSYGTSYTNPYMVLIQGSGAAPGAWSAIGTMIITAYKTNGHGAIFEAAWSGLVLVIATLLFVDDTDLLHMSKDPLTTDKDFVCSVQSATSYWAHLLQATGGNLNPNATGASSHINLYVVQQS
jgi:hypothetical protein